jgi:RimJ/RimL family protein N-acetyltransferase
MDVRAPETPLGDGVVSLQPWRDPDVAELVAALDGDPEITHWMHQIPQPYTESDARGYISASTAVWRAGSGATFAVRDESQRIAGSLGMRVIDAEDDVVEVGYWTAAHSRGRGLTTRALVLVSHWLFDTVGAARIQLRADVENIASQRVAEKAGFVREGVLRSSGVNARLRRRVDYVMYSLLPDELE